MKNISEYTVPRRYSKWHCFMNGLATFVFKCALAVIVLLVMLTATIMIWGR